MQIGVLFVADGPGGGRAILPVINKMLHLDCFTPLVVNYSFLGLEAPLEAERIPIGVVSSSDSFLNLTKEYNIKRLIFGTGLENNLLLGVLNLAKKNNVKSLMMLDNWTNYSERLFYRGYLHLPDIYGVPDRLAEDEAIMSGIPRERIKVIGHPDIGQCIARFDEINKRTKDQGLRNKSKKIIFFSEPVEQDQGSDLNHNGYRGYTEKTVLRAVLDFMSTICIGDAQLIIAPHPREDPIALGKCLNIDNYQNVEIGPKMVAENYLCDADGVIGMSSIALYKAWVLGLPVCSIQPNLIRDDLRSIFRRNGVFYSVEEESITLILKKWYEKVIAGCIENQKELDQHKNAISNVIDWSKKGSL